MRASVRAARLRAERRSSQGGLLPLAVDPLRTTYNYISGHDTVHAVAKKMGGHMSTMSGHPIRRPTSLGPLRPSSRRRARLPLL